VGAGVPVAEEGDRTGVSTASTDPVADPAVSAPRPNESAVVGNYTVERVNDTIFRFEYRFEVAPNVEHLNLTVGPVADELAFGTDQFEREGSESGYRTFEYAGDGGNARVVAKANLTTWPKPAPSGVGTDEWALVMSPYSLVEWNTTANESVRTVYDDTVAHRDGWTHGAKNGSYVPSLYAYFGPHETWNATTAGGGEVTLIVPDAVPYQGQAERRFETMVEATERIDVEQPDATGVVSPQVKAPGDLVFRNFNYGGIASFGNGFIVQNRYSPEVWIHEYLHVVQDFGATNETAWLVEGTAQYYGNYLTVEYGGSYASQFVDRITDTRGKADAVLDDPTTWSDGLAEYHKGKLVVAYLDGQIQRMTENRSFFDVLRRLNAHEGEVSASDFEDAVAAVVGNHTLDDDIENYTSTTAYPSEEEVTFPPEIESELSPRETATPETTTSDSPEKTATTSAVGETTPSTGDPTTTTAVDAGSTTTPEGNGKGMPGFGPVTAVLALLAAVIGIALGRRDP
jgi:hypothetical protein